LNANPIALVVAAIAALAAGLYIAYQKSEWFREKVNAAWEMLKGFWSWIVENLNWDNFVAGLQNVGAAISNFFAAPLTTIMTLIKDIVGAWDNLMKKIGIGGNTEATINAMQGVQARMDAGEYQQGDDMLGSAASWAQVPAHGMGGIFSTPHVGMVAEAGKEAVVPLSDRSRGIPLWMAAGEEMGMKFGSNSTTTNNVTGGSPSINITVNGGDPGIAQRVAEEVKRALREIQEYDDRTQLA
jgi:hypothetical protein